MKMDQVYRFVAVTVGFWSSDAHANVEATRITGKMMIKLFDVSPLTAFTEATRITGMLFAHDKKMDITILRVDVEEHG